MKHVILTAAQIGQLLHSARKASGQSQAELATRVSLSQPRLSKLEQSPGDATVDQLLALCTSLGLELVVQKRGLPDPDATQPPPEW